MARLQGKIWMIKIDGVTIRGNSLEYSMREEGRKPNHADGSRYG